MVAILDPVLTLSSKSLSILFVGPVEYHTPGPVHRHPQRTARRVAHRRDALSFRSDRGRLPIFSPATSPLVGLDIAVTGSIPPHISL